MPAAKCLDLKKSCTIWFDSSVVQFQICMHSSTRSPFQFMIIADAQNGLQRMLAQRLEKSLGMVGNLCELIHRVVRDIKVQPILFCAEFIEAVQEAPENCTIGWLNQSNAPLVLTATTACVVCIDI
jgi:hypothetical protein